jgi:predicted transcriptional regulator
VAKELVKKYGYTQEQAAKKLGMTQPAISQYLSSKRGRKGIPNYDEVAPLVKEAAVKVAKKVAKTGMSTEEFRDSFCDLCRKLQEIGKISVSHGWVS